MRGSARILLALAAAAIVLIAAAADAALSTEAILSEYRRLQSELSRLPSKLEASETQKSEITALLERVWPIVGEWLVAHLAASKDAVDAGRIAAWIRELDPAVVPTPAAGGDVDDIGDQLAVLARYRLHADALALGAARSSPWAVAVTYGLVGRLFVVSPATIVLSADIQRGGALHRLPDGRNGKRRFYVDARSDDWPTSACRGGELSIWEWDGAHAVPALVRGYSDIGLDPGWGVRVEGATMRVATRNELRTFSDSCSGHALKAVRTIHLAPERIEDQGLRYDVPELPLVDDLFYRTLRGDDVSDLATPEVAKDLSAILRTACRVDDSYSLGMLAGWHAEPTATGKTFTLALDPGPRLVFRLVRRDGRWRVAGVDGPNPRVRRLQAAMSATIQRRGLNALDAGVRRTVAADVLRARPDLDPGADGVRAAIDAWEAGCEDVPWPWR